MLQVEELNDRLIDLAFSEDIGDGDHTTLCCIPADAMGESKLLIKEEGIFAGVDIAKRVFHRFDPELVVEVYIEDGAHVKPGDIVMSVKGREQSLLQTERLMLNILQRMSGIATMTHKYQQALIDAGVDRIYVGEKDYGLRLPQTLSYDEINRIAQLVHAAGKELTVAVNALMHQSMMDSIKPFLDFLKEIQADYITVGDAGVFYVLKRDGYPFKTIYDASTMVTSSRQINFWGKQAGASEAVLAREIPSAELFVMAENLQIPAEVLVYGASIIHHSKRPLLQNYYNFIKTEDSVTKDRDLFLAEPGDPNSHYSVYEDKHGTHIFSNNDLNMMTKLSELVEHGFDHWKLDGVYCPGENFVKITEYFVKARDLIQKGTFTQDQAYLFDEEIRKLHPANRGLDTGFYDYEPDRVK